MFGRFRALSQKQQIMLVAAVFAASCVVLGGIWYFFLRTPYEPLFTNLRANDAATIVSDLDRKKVPYRLADGGTTVLVPANAVESTRLKVMTEDLPLKGTVGFELFNKSDMGLTDFAQKINYQRALQGELERTIMTLDGVSSARVHVSLGEDRLFRENQVPPKASVMIRMAKGASLDVGAVSGLQRMIAAAVPKLEAADVVVLDEEGRPISAAPAPPNAALELTPALEQRRAVEEFYAAKIRQALSAAYSQISVRVEAAGADGSWSPSSRTFPLRVVLLAGTVIEPAARPALRDLVAAAIGVGNAGGDTVEFAIEPPRELPVVAPDIKVVKTAPHREIGRWRSPPENKEMGWELELAYALVPVVMLVGILVLLLRARRPRKLTEEQRAEFAQKLQRALAKEPSHAAP